jgi:hypothetical protein
MAAKKANPAFELVVNHLKKHPDAPYADVKAAATKAGHTVYPIVYGRAKALLGLVESVPRGSGKAKRKAAASAGAPAASPKRRGRPRKEASTSSAPKRRGRPKKSTSPAPAAAGTVDSVLGAVRAMEAERDQLRAALIQIRDLINGVV